MKYLVIYQMDGFRSAKAFGSHSDAVDYINDCTDIIDKNISELKTLDDAHFRMTLKNGKIFNIKIESVDEDNIRYDLIYDKNNRHVETRRFTKRQLAVDYAHKILEKLGFDADKDEDKFGEWEAKNPEENLKATMIVNLVILNGAKADSSDYALLGIKSNASEEEIKSAYRTMSKKYHPDTGGDPAKFAEIHDAYERIRDGKAHTSAKPQVTESYSSTDMKFFFTNLNEKVDKLTLENEKDKVAAYAMIRSAALKLMGRGFVWLVIGGLIIAFLSSLKSFPAFLGIFAYFFIVNGLRFLAKGFGYYISPGSAIKELK